MKNRFIISAVAAALILSGCAKTDKPDIIEPSDLLDSSSLSESVGGDFSENVVSKSESGNSADDTPVNEDRGVLKRVSVSERNAFVSSAREFVIDEENLRITLDVSYFNYVDIRTLENCLLDIEINGGTYALDGKVNAGGGVDLTEDAYLTVTDERGERKRFTVTAERTVHDLPIVNIYLENNAAVSSIQRDVMTNMEMYIDCGGSSEFLGTNVLSGGIRGRGHSTWGWAKKPYRIKLDESASILGLPKNRDWILLANHADKSLIRNIVAYDMARELGFVWTGTQYPVDLFVNGVYRGVYALGEHSEIAKNRIPLDESNDIDRGYLLEVGGSDDDMLKGYDYFHTNSNLVRFITFDDPKADKLTEEQRRFVIDYVNAADAAIVSGVGYEQYIDVESFCDWIILHELTCNLDSCFRRSCYMTKDKGGKLKMGPVWDFDLAFGNFYVDPDYDTWFTVGSGDEDAYIGENWCSVLMENESFRARLRERWFEVRDVLLGAAQRSIDANKAKIYASQIENFRLWGTMGTRNGSQSEATAVLNTYEAQVGYIESFLDKRAKWIDENI